MVRLAALVLGAGLAAAKTVDLTSSPSSAPIQFPGAAVSEQTLERAHQKGRHVSSVGHGQLSAPPAVVKRDGSFHSSEYTQHGGGHTSGGSYGPTGHSVGGYSTGGYSTGGYTQPSYSSYGGDDYGYTEATTYENGGGGFLGGIGKYGLIIIPILLGITLLFLFPSVINVAANGTGRDNRALGDQEDLSNDLLQRAMSIYTSISEDPLCVNRLFCEMGSTLGHTSFADRTLQYIDYFFAAKSDNMQVLKKAARAKDPQCHVLACKAWEDKFEALRQRGSGEKTEGSTEKTSSQRQQRI